MSVKPSKDAVIAQYHEAAEMHRNFNREFWQITSLLFVVASGVVGASYVTISNLVVRAILLALGTGFSFVLLIVLGRVRVFSYNNVKSLASLENDMGLRNLTWTREYFTIGPENWLEHLGAFQSFIYFAMAIPAVLFVLFCFNLLALFGIVH